MADIGDYKPNSYKSKTEATEVPQKKEEKVVTGPVKTKKKSSVLKLTDVFISEDISNVKNYIVMDVLVPAIKKAVSDIVTNGIDMILYGGTKPGNKSSGSSYVSYNRFSDRNDPTHNYTNNRTRTGYSYDDVLIDSRGEAEEVLERMGELIDTYGVVTVADMYDLVGITCNYTDNKYGWTNIRNASIERVRDGYMLKMPKALPID